MRVSLKPVIAGCRWKHCVGHVVVPPAGPGRRKIRRTLFAVVMIVVLVFAVALLATGCGTSSPASRSDSSTGRASTTPSSTPAGTAPSTPSGSSPEAAPPAPAAAPFAQQAFKNNKTIHFVSSDPPNNALLSAPPGRVTVNFSSDLGSGSFISVKVNDMEVTTGGMILPLDNRSVSVAVNPYAGTGNYAVNYAAYWSDGSYCEGSFGFSVKLP